MYKKITKILLAVTICIFFSLPTKVNANIYSLNDLIENGKEFDKKEVTVKGEAIGEALERKDYTWININDTTNAMGIYMTKEDANKVKTYGGYSKIGDTIQVSGQFNRACKEHGGDMDIHAKKVELVKKGEILKQTFPKTKVYIAAVSLIIVAILYKIYKKEK